MAEPIAANQAPSSPSNELRLAQLLFVIGGPGVGKGTQCSRMAKDLNLVHVSVGDLMRAERQNESEIGILAEKHLRNGSLVPDHLTFEVLEKHIAKHLQEGENRFLIDGFPRSMEQLKLFENKTGRTDTALLFKCPKEIMCARVVKRGETSKRVDDNPQTFETRYQKFLGLTENIEEHFRKARKLIEVDTEPPLDELYDGIRSTTKRVFEDLATQSMPNMPTAELSQYD